MRTPQAKPPCVLCGEVLYDPTSVRHCRPCGEQHDALCIQCVAGNGLTSIKEVVRKPHGRLLVCPDQVRVARAVMGDGDRLEAKLRAMGDMR